jgi:hypothetical protein
LHQVLPPVALRTTAVLQNSEKKFHFASLFFRTSRSRSALAVIAERHSNRQLDNKNSKTI